MAFLAGVWKPGWLTNVTGGKGGYSEQEDSSEEIGRKSSLGSYLKKKKKSKKLPVIPAMERLAWDDWRLKVILGYTARPCLKIKK